MTTTPDPKQSPFPTSENHGKPPGDAQPTSKKPREGALDEGIEESFPASDPVSVNVTKIKKPADRDDESKSAGNTGDPS